LQIEPKTIYFIHSTGFDFKAEYYSPIRESRLSKRHKLIFPHDTSHKPFASRELFKSGKCDLVVAEVSFPSTGGGIEIGWAHAFNIPILMVAREDSNTPDSLGNLGLSFLRYGSKEDLALKVNQAVEAFCGNRQGRKNRVRKTKQRISSARNSRILSAWPS
jgi:hypothetical protein